MSLASDLASALPGAFEIVRIRGDTLPEFEDCISRSDGGGDVTIAPPLGSDGRGTYVSNNCAPMASKKSFHSRLYHASKKQITAVIAVRVSYALNAQQEWNEVAADGGDAAGHTAAT